MKIALAQVKMDPGSIGTNGIKHQKWIEQAVAHQADLIMFPELSLTSYEPSLAKELAMNQNDSRLKVFQNLSNSNNVTILLGFPGKSTAGHLISMAIFQPNNPLSIYSKQMLHEDELPYFIAGSDQVILKTNQHTLAPAICYESLQESHAEAAHRLGADIYLASVAKSENGIQKASNHYPQIAQKLNMTVLMANTIGDCDNFVSAGQSAVWTKNGSLIQQLSNDREGLLLYDTISEKAYTVYVNQFTSFIN